jgi:hypothetical protein
MTDFGTPAEKQTEQLQTICELLTLIHNELDAIKQLLKKNKK